MITKFKNDLHKKDTLTRNLNYQIKKYCLLGNYFNDLKGGSPKDNLTEYINLEELEQLRNEFNSKIIKILEDNRATYLKGQISIDFIPKILYQKLWKKVLINLLELIWGPQHIFQNSNH